MGDGHYRQVLSRVFLDFVKSNQSSTGVMIEFMQESAAAHTAAVARKYQGDEANRIITWPTYSPNFNPVETVKCNENIRL